MLQQKHKSLYGRDLEVCGKVKLLVIISKIPTVSNRKQNIRISKKEHFSIYKNIDMYSHCEIVTVLLIFQVN